MFEIVRFVSIGVSSGRLRATQRLARFGASEGPGSVKEHVSGPAGVVENVNSLVSPWGVRLFYGPAWG